MNILEAAKALRALVGNRWPGNPDPEIAKRNVEWNKRLAEIDAAIAIAEKKSPPDGGSK